MFETNDVLHLLEDEVGLASLQRAPWKVMIVDDDGEVHQATRFALSGVTVLDRPLSLIHAYSAAEAETLLRQMDDVSVVFLDAVMEADDSGLSLMDIIRDELSYDALRVILRTGQPGMAPEAALVADYDIHDYMLKSEVSRDRLLTSLTTALRTYQQLTEQTTLKLQIAQLTRQVPALLAAPINVNVLARFLLRLMQEVFDVAPRLVLWQTDVQREKQDAQIVAANMNDQQRVGRLLTETDGQLANVANDMHSLDNGYWLVVPMTQGRFLVYLSAPISSAFQRESWQLQVAWLTSCARLIAD